MSSSLAKVSLMISTLAAAAVALSSNGSLNVPIGWTIPFLSFYIFTVLYENSTDNILNYIYISIFTITIGSLLVSSSDHIIGFSDAFAHYDAWNSLFRDGSITFHENSSFNFVSIYILTEVIYLVSSISGVQTVQMIIPLLFTTTGVLFYAFCHSLSFRRLLPLVSIYLFSLNWGVFRFNLEYRSLIIALPILILFLHVIYKSTQQEVTRRWSIAGILIAISFTTTHFATIIFAGPAIMAIGLLIYTRKRSKTFIIPLLLLIPFFYLYISYITKTFNIAVQSRIIQIYTLYMTPFGSETAETTSSAIDFYRMLEYGIWLVFGVASFNYLRKDLFYKERNINFISILLIYFSLLFFVSLLGNIVLNPDRARTYLAIPFSYVLSNELLSLRDSITTTWKKPLYHILVFCLIVSVATTAILGLPVGVVGETEPIRQYNESDYAPHLTVDDRDEAARTFAHRYQIAGDNTNYEYKDQSQTMRIYYENIFNESNPSETEFTISDWKGDASPGQNTIYSNGDNTIWFIN